MIPEFGIREIQAHTGGTLDMLEKYLLLMAAESKFGTPQFDVREWMRQCSFKKFVAQGGYLTQRAAPEISVSSLSSSSSSASSSSSFDMKEMAAALRATEQESKSSAPSNAGGAGSTSASSSASVSSSASAGAATAGEVSSSHSVMNRFGSITMRFERFEQLSAESVLGADGQEKNAAGTFARLIYVSDYNQHGSFQAEIFPTSSVPTDLDSNDNKDASEDAEVEVDEKGEPLPLALPKKIQLSLLMHDVRAFNSAQPKAAEKAPSSGSPRMFYSLKLFRDDKPLPL